MRCALLLAFALAAVSSFADAPVVYFQASRQGESEPCGCPVEQLGGVARLERARAALGTGRGIFVDAGDTFFPGPALPAGKETRALRQAQLIADSLRIAKLDVLTPSEWDWAAGESVWFDLVKRTGAAAVAANVSGPSLQRFVVIDRAKARIAVTGLVPSLPTSSTLRSEDKEKALTAVVRDVAAQKVDLLVILVPGGVAEARDLVAKVWNGAPAKPAHAFIVAGRYGSGIDAAEKVAPGLWLAEPESEGKMLGRLEWTGDEPAVRYVKLNRVYQTAGPVDALLKAFQRETASEARGKAVAPKGRDVSFAASAHRCAQCHQAQYDFWKSTKHASAYLVLYAKGAHVDPECIRCHSVGFEEPGGFEHVLDAIEGPVKKAGKKEKPLLDRLLATTFAKDGKLRPLDSRVEPRRFADLKARYHTELDKLVAQGKVERVWAGVQCENCHGSRLAHLEGDRTKKSPPVTAATCTSCHRDMHDPDFDFAADLPKVACPRK